MTDDPLDFERIDREIRINELKERASELAGEEITSFEPDDDGDPEHLRIREAFWEHVVDVEQGGWTTSREQLHRQGVELPPPEGLTDEQLRAKLDEVIDRLAALRTFFYNTDHLSDRELYTLLWHDTLNEQVPACIAASADGAQIVDLVSSGSDEDIDLWMKYYADERTRQNWLRDFPNYAMPRHEDPPYDRDRHLPRPPAERMSQQRKPRPQDKPVDLEKLVDEMDMQGDEVHLYYDCDASEVACVTDEFSDFGGGSDDESDDSVPDWQREARDLARAVDDDEEGVRFVALPDRVEIHEWDIMRRFAEGAEDEALSHRLQEAIQGKGAFRHFENVLYEAGIRDQWFAFRKQALLEIAREWAQWHNIPVKAGTADHA